MGFTCESGAVLRACGVYMARMRPAVLDVGFTSRVWPMVGPFRTVCTYPRPPARLAAYGGLWSRAEPVRRACLALPTGSDPNGRPIVRHYGYHLSLTIVLSSCKPHALRSAAYVLSDKINPCGLEPQLIKLEFIIYLPKLKVVCCYTCTDDYDYHGLYDAEKHLNPKVCEPKAALCL